MSLTKERINSGFSGEMVTGVVLIRGMEIGKTKRDAPFIYGNVNLFGGATIPYKVWDGNAAFNYMQNNTPDGQLVSISAEINIWEETRSLIFKSVSAVDGNVSDYMASKYDVEAYWLALRDLVSKSVSVNALEIADKVLFNNQSLAESFKREFAASSHHDNCKGGLLAHTYKVVKYTIVTMQTYPKLKEKYADITILGSLFHDMGKTVEMNNGVYQSVPSTVTHRYLGVEMLDKGFIVERMGEKFYYDLVSVLLQHHDNWGDPCRTIASYIVSNADLIESRMALINQTIEEMGGIEVKAMKMDDRYLSF